MRIAMLTNNYRPFVGGVPISVERQAEELIKLGHQVTVFAPMYGETQEEREAVLAADVSAPEQVVRYGTQKRKMDNGMVYPSFYPSEIMEAFERDEFDCIHVHHPKPDQALPARDWPRVRPRPLHRHPLAGKGGGSHQNPPGDRRKYPGHQEQRQREDVLIKSRDLQKHLSKFSTVVPV